MQDQDNATVPTSDGRTSARRDGGRQRGADGVGASRSPVRALVDAFQTPLAQAAQQALPAALRALAEAPILRFHSGQPLALLPFIGLD